MRAAFPGVSDTETVPTLCRMTTAHCVVRLQGVRRDYCKPDGSILVEALRGVDLEAMGGEYIAVMGPSGSGKSTLMNILGCLDRPSAGSYQLDGINVSHLDDTALSDIRGRRIGFVFQSFNLISELTIEENVEVPLFYQGVGPAQRRERAIKMLQRVGLGDRLSHRPTELSGGQQQRAAIARSLVVKPAMLLADEPTGNLDSATGSSILALLDELHQEGLTMFVVTHDSRIAERCQRVIHLEDGAIDCDTSHGMAQ